MRNGISRHEIARMVEVSSADFVEVLVVAKLGIGVSPDFGF
jgi:hypothetical protein